MDSRAAPFSLPDDYGRIKVVGSFDELASTRFTGELNALCWPRILEGDFNEVVERLGSAETEGVVALDEERLQALALSRAGREAVDVLIGDRRKLSELGLAPELNCITGYPRDPDAAVVSTDVYSFHADSATVEADTWLCTYVGAPSEGLCNDDAIRCVDVPATRTTLLHRFGGRDDESFAEFLAENCYDLHYVPRPSARVFSFGRGNLWRIAADYPGSPIPPCIHRAPETRIGAAPRLLLIS